MLKLKKCIIAKLSNANANANAREIRSMQQQQ
jgi:hypothetical protein